jgi:predicted ATP-dependent serine protease
VRVRAPRVGDEEIDEDASTLAVCLSLLSAAERLQLPPVAAFGSLSPTGRVQTDGMAELRVSAALKAQIPLVFGPPLPANVALPEGVTYIPVATVRDLVEAARIRGVHVPEAAEVVAVRDAARRKRPANRGEEPFDL